MKQNKNNSFCKMPKIKWGKDCKWTGMLVMSFV